MDYLQPTYQRSLQITTLNRVYNWNFKANILEIDNKFRKVKKTFNFNKFNFNNTYIDEIKDFLTGGKSKLAKFKEFKNVIETIQIIKNQNGY